MKQIQRLAEIMSALRDPETGCAWDLKQSHQSLIPYLVEESYEVIDAIDAGDDAHLREELGDLLFQVVFHAQIAKEGGRFTLEEVAESIADKLVRRHPHVFDNVEHDSDSEREAAWAEQKQQERQQKDPDTSVLDGIPEALPALMRSQKLQRRAARVGFDWENVNQVIPKIHEELKEVEEAVAEGESAERIAEEVGDLLFAVVNLARKLNVDSENALRLGNAKFCRRFGAVEKLVSESNQGFESTSLNELNSLWNEVKRREKQLLQD